MIRSRLDRKPDTLLASSGKICLELGCGTRRIPGRIGIDRLPLPTVDMVADLEEGLPLSDNCADEIHSKSLLEHISNFEFLMGEIARVLKPGGKAYLYVPHFSNPYYYSDYTHVRFFGLYTFYYFVATEHQMKRKVPDFYSGIRFRVLSQRLIFHSPFKWQRPVKKIWEYIFNITPGVQEFYEANLSYLFPCYALEVVLTPDK